MSLLQNNKYKEPNECEYCHERTDTVSWRSRLLPVSEPVYVGNKFSHHRLYEREINECTKMANCNKCNCDIVIYFERSGYYGGYRARIQHDPSLRRASTCKFQRMYGYLRPWSVVSKKVTIPSVVHHSFKTYICPQHPFNVYGYNAGTYLAHQNYIHNRFSKVE